MPTTKNIWVVIPNWNGADLIVECLESLTGQTEPHHVIVVDNGSVDDSIAVIEKQFPDVTLLKQPENLGFAGGVNVGIQHAIKHGVEYIALLNNDAVADKHWLKHLLKALSSSDSTAIVASKMIQANTGHIDSTGEQYSIWGMPFPRGRGEPDSGQYDNKTTVFGASGGASLYRATLFEDIGYFDEVFFAYYEDADLSFRAQLAGWSITYQPKAVVHHRIGATSEKLGNFTRYHATKNFYLLYLKNMPLSLLLKYWVLFISQAFILFLGNARHGAARTHIRAEWAVIKQLNRTANKRHVIQSQRRVSPKHIESILHHGRNPRPPKL